LEETAEVQLQVRKIDGFVQRAEKEWPLARTRWTKHLPQPGGLQFRQEARGKTGSLISKPSVTVTFMTPPLKEETEITGLLLRTVRLPLTTDADLFLVLRSRSDLKEVVFQGALDPTPHCSGWLRASHRKLDPAISTKNTRPYHTHDVERTP